MSVLLGVDWAEDHHDLCLLDRDGRVLATRRIPEGLEGVAALHALVADHADDPTDVIVGIETDRGLLVGALVAAGCSTPATSGRFVPDRLTRSPQDDVTETAA